MAKKTDLIIFTAIYLYALTVAIVYAVTKLVIISDQTTEYELYLAVITNHGAWTRVTDSIVNTSVLLYMPPAWIQLAFHTDLLLTFKLYPCFLFALTPAFVYLASRHYLNIRYSVLSTFLILLDFYFINYPALGRVAIAWGLMSMLIWALAEKRVKTSCVLAFLLVFAHYGTTYICLGLLGGAAIWAAIRSKHIDWSLAAPTIVLAVISSVWYSTLITAGTVPSYTRSLFTSSLASLTSPDISSILAANYLFNAPLPPILEATFKVVFVFGLGVMLLWSNRHSSIYRIGIVFLYYFIIGLTISILSVSWIMFVILGLSLGYVVYKKTGGFGVMQALAYSLIPLSIFVPRLSAAYGVGRVYFTIIIILAPVFMLGVQAAEKYMRLPQTSLAVLVLALFGIYTANIGCWWPVHLI